MLNRFALVIHWLGLFLGGWAFALGVSIAYEGNDDWAPLGWGFMGFCILLAVGWVIRFILTGSKLIFPWNKPAREPES
jgi:hypothetical protein